jgi:hypothetical protein
MDKVNFFNVIVITFFYINVFYLFSINAFFFHRIEIKLAYLVAKDYNRLIGFLFFFQNVLATPKYFTKKIVQARSVT